MINQSPAELIRTEAQASLLIKYVAHKPDASLLDDFLKDYRLEMLNNIILQTNVITECVELRNDGVTHALREMLYREIKWHLPRTRH